MSSWLLALYTRLGGWLYLVAPRFLRRKIERKQTETLKKLARFQHPMYAPRADRMDRLCDALALIISGTATTEQMLALLLVIVLQAVYVGLLMRSVHRQRDNRPDTQ